MSAALIVAEPETETRGFLERQLSDDGFDVLGASHPGEVFDLAERVRPDLVLVAELELCTRLRDGVPGRSWDRDVPVILLGREEANAVDRTRALERGADDYVDRPFAYEELRARIRAVLRRAAPKQGDVLEAGELRIDRPTRCVLVCGRRLLLPAKSSSYSRSWPSSRRGCTRRRSCCARSGDFDRSVEQEPWIPTRRVSAGGSPRSPRRPTWSTCGGWAIG
jgi:DNA-binding response OmpR family regulator